MIPGPDFTALVQRILQQHPQGISEYALIKRLMADAHGPFSSALSLSDPLTLFRVHFALFHNLYRLRDKLRLARCHELVISASCIRLEPFVPGARALAQEDRLRSYYVDWSHFAQTDVQEVNDLLDNFWRRVANDGAGQQRTEDLALLGLTPSADKNLIRRRYRQLMHQHHPDKGGDMAYCQMLTQAYQRLL